jgi:hypothetical protein
MDQNNQNKNNNQWNTDNKGGQGNNQNNNQWNTGQGGNNQNNNNNNNQNNNSGNNNWNTGNNNNNKSGLGEEYMNRSVCTYLHNNYNYANENSYQIFSDNQVAPKHNVTPDSLNTPWWKSLTYPKNPLFFTHAGNAMHCFDITLKKWVKLANNSNQFFPKYHRITELPDSSFMMTGGEVNGGVVTNAFHYYNQNFAPKESMNNGRKAHGHIYCKGMVYVFGGFDNYGTISSVERYDMNNGGWTNMANMIVPKAYVSCCRFSDDYLFLIGGFSSQDNDGIKEQESIDRYDIKNNTHCTFKVKLPIASYGFACTMISNDEILICGGINNRTGKSSKVFVADLGKAFIKNLPDLPSAGWTIFPVYYNNGSFNILFQGEETEEEGLPDLIVYNTMIGL